MPGGGAGAKLDARYAACYPRVEVGLAHGCKRDNFHTRHKRTPREKAARIRLGSLEFKKKGVSRFDMRDPYHLAVALTWPQFFAALLLSICW